MEPADYTTYVSVASSRVCAKSVVLFSALTVGESAVSQCVTAAGHTDVDSITNHVLSEGLTIH